jgi:hypothetical protein
VPIGILDRAMKASLKRLFALFGNPGNTTPNKSREAFISKNIGANQQLSNVEIRFLELLEGKRADDSSVLGWWCAFNNIDGHGPKIIDKLSKNNYLTFADYKFNIRKATIPILKDFLRRHKLPVNGKKADLVTRIIENISETDCLSYFNHPYWALTPKAVELLRAEGVKAEAEYSKDIELIRRGSYDELKKKLYPNKNEHWGTEDTFFDTIDFLMKHGFEEFGLSEDVRENISSFVARRAVDYSSRGYSTCKKDISNYLSSLNIELKTLKLPPSLENYTKENEIEDYDEIYNIYIQFIIYRAIAIAELNNYKRLGFKKIKISVVKDARTCSDCLSKGNKAYSVTKAPLLPLCWGCRCCYLLVED